MQETTLINDNSLKTIVPCVLLLHLLAILSMNHFSTWKPEAPPVKRMVVTSVKLQPKPLPPAKPVSKPSAPVKAKAEEPIAQKEEVMLPQAKEEVVQPKAKEEPLPKEVVAEEIISPPQEKPATTPKPTSKKAAPKSVVKAKKGNKKPPPSTSKKASAKKPVAKKAAPKQPVKKTAPVADNGLKEKQRALLKQAREKMGKVDLKGSPLGAIGSDLIAAATPSSIDNLHVDTLTFESSEALSIKELAYRDELAQRLKLLLTLPEYGEVKIKLTLDRAGQVISVKTLNAQSSANKSYIEKTVPKLKMPSFGTNFGQEPTQTFTITMSNE